MHQIFCQESPSSCILMLYLLYIWCMTSDPFGFLRCTIVWIRLPCGNYIKISAYFRYSIWIDSKLRLHADPMLILEYFLWRKRSEYAISNHYDRHCVWEEVLQNKRLNKYNHSAIDEQFGFYQSDGLTKFNASDENALLPSCACQFYSFYCTSFCLFCCRGCLSLSILFADVPEGSVIVRAHTPMSNLFSCLWFNEVNRFTSRDQLSFAYTFLKLRRMNQGKQFFLNMFKVWHIWIIPIRTFCISS